MIRFELYGLIGRRTPGSVRSIKSLWSDKTSAETNFIWPGMGTSFILMSVSRQWCGCSPLRMHFFCSFLVGTWYSLFTNAGSLRFSSASRFCALQLNLKCCHPILLDGIERLTCCQRPEDGELVWLVTKSWLYGFVGYYLLLQLYVCKFSSKAPSM